MRTEILKASRDRTAGPILPSAIAVRSRSMNLARLGDARASSASASTCSRSPSTGARVDQRGAAGGGRTVSPTRSALARPRPRRPRGGAPAQLPRGTAGLPGDPRRWAASSCRSVFLLSPRRSATSSPTPRPRSCRDRAGASRRSSTAGRGSIVAGRRAARGRPAPGTISWPASRIASRWSTASDDDLAVILIHQRARPDRPRACGAVPRQPGLERAGAPPDLYELDRTAWALMVLPPPLAPYGLTVMNAGHILGTKGVLLRWFNPEGVLDTIQRYRVQSMAGVPTMFVYLLQLSRRRPLRHLVHALVGLGRCAAADRDRRGRSRRSSVRASRWRATA